MKSGRADKCLDDANTAIDNDEPLNIDTVMTLMRYWYEDYSLMHDKDHNSSLFAEERHQTLNTDIEYSERNNCCNYTLTVSFLRQLADRMV